MAALRKEDVDRMPWSPLIDGYCLSSFKGDRKFTDVELMLEIGADVMSRHVPAISVKRPGVSAYGVGFKQLSDVKLSVKSNKGELNMLYETPVGSLTEKIVMDKSSPWVPWVVEHKIKTVEDVKVLMFITEKTGFEQGFKMFSAREKEIGDSGIASASAPATPVQQFINHECGVENFAYLFHDAKDLMLEAFELMHAKNLEYYRLMAESPADVVITYENTSSSTTSPSIYKEHEQPYMNEYADILHDADKIHLTHMCGRLNDFAPIMKDCRQDGFADISPGPTGDLPMDVAKDYFGDEKVIMGGIDATAFVDLEPKEMEEYVEGILESLGHRTRGVILGSADATPYGTTIENLKAVTKVVNDYS